MNLSTASECQGDDLAANLECTAVILVLEEKDPSHALPILTLIALGAVGLLARLDYFYALTVRTLSRDRDQMNSWRAV